MSDNKSLIYVDGVSGDDSNSGSILSPVRTLQRAYDISWNGSVIVLQYSPISYGDLTVSKNLTLLSSSGSRSTIGEIQIYSAQAHLLRLDFASLTGSGVIIDNLNISKTGSFQIEDCNFVDIDHPITLKNCHYSSIHRNTFFNYQKAIRINDCHEFTASANVFEDGPQAFEVLNTDYLDIYNNTHIGQYVVPPVNPDNVNARVSYTTLDNFTLSRKYIDLPSYAAFDGINYNVAVNVVYGSSFEYGLDYTVINSGRTVSWDGLGLEQQLHPGDILRIIYSCAEDEPTGELLYVNASKSISRIDSNNISDASIGVHIVSDTKIRYNNFFGTYTGVIGTPTDNTGNISVDPSYVNPGASDYHLNLNSPDIMAADPDREGQILQELGIGVTGGGFTGIFDVERPGVAPFNRNIDRDGIHRFTKRSIHDIGAYEYPGTGINGESFTFVSENGYDVDFPGSETGPYATLDKAFHDAKDIKIATNFLYPEGYIGSIDQGATGIQYGRYFSENLDLSADQVLVGKENMDSVVYIYPTYPSCGLTGVYVGPRLPPDQISGDTGTITNPFLEINDAIAKLELGSATGVIFVYPAIYPSFKGSSIAKIVGLPKLTNIALSKTTYSSLESLGWTGATDAVFSNNSIYFNNANEIQSLFEIKNSFNVRFDFLVINDVMELKVFNDLNYVLFSKSGNTLTFKYYTGGVSHSINTINTDSSYKASLYVKDNSATIGIKGATLTVNDSFNFDSGYTGMWSLDFRYTGSTHTGIIKNFLIESDQIALGDTGMLGVTGTNIERKIFGIAGEKGWSGLNYWYGAEI